MSYLKRNLLALFLFLSFPTLSDINKNPFELIDTKSQEMVVVLTTENELFNTNPELFKTKIKNIFEPLIDFNRVSASVMGKKYYLSATKEERTQFIEVFKISLLDTYAETLAQWGDAEIITDFSYDEKKNKIVSVKQELMTTNNIYPIIYKLREYKNGTRKIGCSSCFAGTFSNDNAGVRRGRCIFIRIAELRKSERRVLSTYKIELI